MNILALGYIGISSTDIESWRRFAVDVVGMAEASSISESEALYLKLDEYAWRLGIFPGDHDGLLFAGWELRDQAAFDQAVSELEQANIPFERGSAELAAQRNVAELLRLRDPSGLSLELFYAMGLDYVQPHTLVSGGFETGYHGDMGLGHFVIPTPHFEECHRFYTQVLGFGQTDYMHFQFSPAPDDAGQGLHFLHVDSPRHHSLALFQDPNPPASGCVHLMVEVKALDEVGYFIDRCKQHGVAIVSSLGRHTNDRMISVYAQSPGGFALEFGCDGVQLDWNSYKPTVSLKPSLWGHDWQMG